MNDPIADMLSRLRNALAVGKTEINLPHAQIKEQVAKVLAKSGFLGEVSTSTESGRKQLHITINQAAENPSLSHIARVSRPGRREYVKAKEIPKIKGGRGIVVLSTSQGIIDGREAAKKGLGGEVICEVY